MKKLTALLLCILFMPVCLPAQTWTPQTSGVSTSLNSAWAASYTVCWICGVGGVVVRTTNGGTTWTSVGGGLLTGSDLYSIFAFDANNAWVGAGDGALYKTTNGGVNWTFVPLTPTNPFIDYIQFWDANRGFVMGDPFGNQWSYYITSNGGTTWVRPANTPPAVGTEAGWNNSGASIDTGHIWWGTNVTKIWKGSYLGPYASCPTTGGINSYGVAFIDANTGISTFSNSTMQRTTNGCTWTANGPTIGVPYGLKGLYTGPYQYFWMCTSLGVFRSTNAGVSFTSQLSGQNFFCISMYNANRGWTATGTGQIYVYNDVLGISGKENKTPTKFALKQNYPNPFNPSTTIYFDLPTSGYISLKLYDASGKEIRTLVDGFMQAGEHLAFFTANDLPSGVYFYTMRSGDFTDSKKMILMK